MKLTLSPKQKELYQDTARYRVAAWGRRCGKTYLAIIEALQAALAKEKAKVVVVSLTLDATFDTYWYLIHELLPEGTIVRTNLTSKEIELRNGSLIKLYSSEKAQKLRGQSIDFVVLDEFAHWVQCQKQLWEGVIRPTLATTEGRALFISSPYGKDYFYELFKQGESKAYPEWSSSHATYKDAFLKELVEEAANEAMNESDSLVWNQEWLASFESSGNRVFYSFGEHNIIEEFELLPEEQIYLGIDFNISIQATIAFVIRDDKVFVFKELFGALNTEELCKQIRDEFGEAPLIAYPDPAGRARKTSAGDNTDFTILNENGIQTLARPSTVSVKAGVNACNRKFRDRKGNVSFFITPNCHRTIRGLDRLLWHDDKLGWKNPDESHYPDAIRYPLDYLWPIRKAVKSGQGKAQLF